MNNTNHKKVINATKVSVVCEVIAKVIAPLTTIVLARLLSQEIFGIVASLTAITALADMLADAGFNAYIVQHQFKSYEEQKGTFNICFWTNIFIALVFFLIIEFNRNEFSRLVGADGYGNVLAIMAIVIPLVSVSSIEMAIMKKELNFKSLGLIKIISKLIPLVVTIPLALWGYGYWSLVLGTLVGELIGMILCLVFGKFIPSFSYPIKYLKSIFSFSIWAYVESILEWLIANLPILVLATIYGMIELGIFKVAVNLVTQITSSIYALYSNVYKSAIAKEQFNPDNFKKMFISFQKYASLFSLPLGIFVFVYRNLITGVILGDQWLDASKLIGFYCLACTMSISFGNFYSDAIRAKGFPFKLVLIDSVYLGLIIGLLFLASDITFALFCVFFSIIKVIQPILQVIIGRKICNVDFIEIIKNSYPQFISSILVAFLMIILGTTSLKSVAGVVSIVCSFILYFCLVYLISPDKATYKEIIFKYLYIRKNR